MLPNAKMEGSTDKIVNSYLKAGMDAESEKVWTDNNGDAPRNENIVLRSVSVKPPEGEDLITVDTGSIFEVEFENLAGKINLDFTMSVRSVEDQIIFESGRRLLGAHHEVDCAVYPAQG